jgi:hypothetical protein
MTSMATGGNLPRSENSRRKEAPPASEVADVKDRPASRRFVGPIEISGSETIAEPRALKAAQKRKSRRRATAARKSKQVEKKAIEKLGPSRVMIASNVLFILAEFALIDLEWSHRIFKLWDPRFVLLPMLVALPFVACRYFSAELRRYQDGKVNHLLMRELNLVFSCAIIPTYFCLLYVCSCALWHWCRELGVFLSEFPGTMN